MWVHVRALPLHRSLALGSHFITRDSGSPPIKRVTTAPTLRVLRTVTSPQRAPHGEPSTLP